MGNLRPGSKILITSRNPQVGHVTGSSKHHLPPLGDDDCFQLFEKCANTNRNLTGDDSWAIQHYKKELVGKCKGLPLLAYHLGLLVSAATNRTAKVEEIVTTDLWKLLKSEKILPDLMPERMLEFQSYLRRCLAYCSLFPRDYAFKEDNLVQLWMAEGFVPYNTTMDTSYSERTVGEHFDQLLSNSVFHGEERSYKMYQLFHDLAQGMASKIFLQVDAGTPNFTSSSDVRHLSLSCPNIENIIENLFSIMTNSKTLRTFLLMDRAGEKIKIQPTFFKSLGRIRVLDLSHTNLTDVVSGVSNLKHLRYLDLSNTPVKTLPSLKELLALELLKLNECTELNCLPNDLSTLNNLVCLQVDKCPLASMPPNIGKLTNLQTLELFVVGNAEGYKIAELENMNNLRKSICITQLENVKDESEAGKAMLHVKTRLKTLELEWRVSATDEEGKQSAQNVLEGLQPPKSLTGLKIRNYSGTKFPEWLVKEEVCGGLGAIELHKCNGCTTLPSLWQLGRLKTLHIVELKLEKVGVEFFGEGTDESKAFPALESLEFSNLPRLTRLGEPGPDCMPKLRDLHIHGCESLEKLPSLEQLTSLKQLQITGCKQLKELPTLPPSLSSEGGRLLIDKSEEVEERCRSGGYYWAKIQGIPSVIINGIEISPIASRNVASENEGSTSQNLTPAPPQTVEENLPIQNEGSSSKNFRQRILGSLSKNKHKVQDHLKHAPVARNGVPLGGNSAPSTSEPVHEAPLQDQGTSEDQPTMTHDPPTSSKSKTIAHVLAVQTEGPSSQNLTPATPESVHHNEASSVAKSASSSSDPVHEKQVLQGILGPTASSTSAVQVSRNVASENEGSSSQNLAPVTPQSAQENLTTTGPSQACTSCPDEESSVANAAPRPSEQRRLPGHPKLSQKSSAKKQGFGYWFKCCTSSVE